jgi:hypothetical protein
MQPAEARLVKRGSTLSLGDSIQSQKNCLGCIVWRHEFASILPGAEHIKRDYRRIILFTPEILTTHLACRRRRSFEVPGAITALRNDASGKAPVADAATTSSAPSAHPEDRAERRRRGRRQRPVPTSQTFKRRPGRKDRRHGENDVWDDGK